MKQTLGFRTIIAKVILKKKILLSSSYYVPLAISTYFLVHKVKLTSKYDKISLLCRSEASKNEQY